MRDSASTTVVRGELTFRPATLQDAAFAADVRTARYPDQPLDPLMVRQDWAAVHQQYVEERFVVLCAAEPAGVAWHEHPPWEKVPKRQGTVRAELLPAYLSIVRLQAAYDFIEERSRASGAELLGARAREGDAAVIGFLTERGYRQDRLQKYWELDLKAQRDHLLTMAEASRARMRAQGFRILTLDQDRDPDAYRKLHAMTAESEQDVPVTVPIPSTPFDEFVEWLRDSPGIREDRIWIARMGDEVVGTSMLSYPPVRGNVSTEWTGTARNVRGRGVARALKLETLVQAIGLGVSRVVTDNDFQNAPILHINESLGYTRIPGWLSFLKPD